MKKLSKRQVTMFDDFYKGQVKIGKMKQKEYEEGMRKIVNSDQTPHIPKKHHLYKWVVK